MVVCACRRRRRRHLQKRIFIKKCCSSTTCALCVCGDVKEKPQKRERQKGRCCVNNNAVASLNAAAMGLANNNNIINMAQTLFTHINLGVNTTRVVVVHVVRVYIYSRFAFDPVYSSGDESHSDISGITHTYAGTFGGILRRAFDSVHTITHTHTHDAGEFTQGLRTGEVQFTHNSAVSHTHTHTHSTHRRPLGRTLCSSHLFVARHATLQSLKFICPSRTRWRFVSSPDRWGCCRTWSRNGSF